MIGLVVAMLVGAFANRFRGGGVGFDFLGTQSRRIIYALIGASVVGVSQSNFDGYVAGGIASYTVPSEAIFNGSLTLVVLFLTLLTGWGRAIGAVGGWERRALEEFFPYDVLAHFATTRILGDHPATKSYKQTWGFIWLTIWGAVTGSLLSLLTGSLLTILSFSCIGLIYYATICVCEKLGLDAGKGWPKSEWIFGAISFASLAL